MFNKKDPTHVPLLASCFTKEQFALCWRYMHIRGNAEDTKGDKLFKLRPLLDLFKERLRFYVPGQYVSVDEIMVAFKGRVNFVQYMPLKPIKRGFKIFAVCCAYTGILLNFEVYTGKKTHFDDDNDTETADDDGSTASMVKRVLEPFLHLWRTAVMDRFFTSMRACELQVGATNTGMPSGHRERPICLLQFQKSA